ncbi:MAG: TolC family protein [Acidobacteriota bacterium]
MLSKHPLLTHTRHLIALLVLAGCVPLAWAQAVPQTLGQAVDAAWARWPEASALPARQAEAQAGLDQARNLTPGPASVSLNHLSDRFNQNLGRREWEVEVATPLWLPGQRAARQAWASQAAAEVEARQALIKLQVAADVREAWWALALAREGAQLARQRLETAQALERSVQRRFKTGDLARLDANLAQTERLAAQAEVLDADVAVQQAQQAYRLLVGAEPPAVLPAEPATGVAPDRPMHPRLQAWQAAAELARSRLDVVSASRREAPELAVRWTTQRSDGTTPYDQAVGLKVTVPLSSSARVSQDSAAARAELAQAETELAQAQARIDQAVQGAQAQWQAAQQQRDLAQQRLTLTDDSLRLAQRSFELGEASLPDLMRARAAAHEAQAWFKRQDVACALAWSRLRQAQGVSP